MRPALAVRSSRSKSQTKSDRNEKAAIVPRTIAAFFMAADYSAGLFSGIIHQHYSAVTGSGLPAT